MSAIGPENVISKIQFGMFGSVDSHTEVSFRAKLVGAARDLRVSGKASISRQAVADLFKGTSPTRGATYAFLHFFLERTIADRTTYSRLPDDRKKVLGQALTFCRRQLKAEITQEIYGTANGHITIRQERIFPPSQYALQTEYFPGTYRVFKHRFFTSKDKPYSEEYLQIRNSNSRHLHIEWWVLLDGKKATSYQGAILLAGTAAWALLYNPALGGRLRVFNTSRADWGRIQPAIHTGLLLSTSPGPQRPRPIAARIFAERIAPISENQIRNKLRHFDQDELDHSMKETILKVISNEVAVDGQFEALENLLYLDEL